MEKFFVAIGVQGLDLENKKGINITGTKSGKCSSRDEAEKWAQTQVANGVRCTFVIFEAISSVKPKESPFVTEELAFLALQDNTNQPEEDHPRAANF